MAEVAAGAVTTLLGVIRNEAVLLRRVRGDVQFIKEEMESMNSFLVHLARSEPPGGEHDEQVRTWMNQMRLLAQDCNDCIDLYLYRGNPDIHRARGGLRGYLWWVSWFLHKLAAQRRAAIRLGELKERARDVGERRLRYGVEVPGKSTPGQSFPATPSSSTVQAAARGYAAGNEEEEDGDDQLVATDRSGKKAFFEPPTLDAYVKAKLLEWISGVEVRADETQSFAIVAPDTDPDALAIAIEVLVFTPERHKGTPGYHTAVMIDIPAVHIKDLPLRPKEILFYILRKLKLDHSKSQSQEQGRDGGVGEEDDLDPWEVYNRKFGIYFEKRQTLDKIKETIKQMKIYEKIDKIKIKNDIPVEPLKGLQQKKDMDQLDLAILLQLLLRSATVAPPQDQVKNKDVYKLPAWDDSIIVKIAKKLKEHMEADEKCNNNKEGRGILEEGEAGEGEEEREGRGGGGGKEECEEVEESEGGTRGGEQGESEGGGEEENCERRAGEHEGSQNIASIHLHEAQYEHILRKVFPKTNSNKPLQAQQQDRSTGNQATNILDEDRIKQMIQEAIRELQEGKYDKNQATCEPSTPGQNPKVVFQDIEQKIDKMKEEFKEQLKIKGLVDDIKNQLSHEKKIRGIGRNYNYCPLFIFKVDDTMDASRLEDTRNALSLLKCSADVLIVTTTKDIQQAQEYCYPRRDPIDYSLAGLYYHRVLKLTTHLNNEDDYNPEIFRDILKECEPNEFCMKIFTHALYINPKRSNEELVKLHKDLQERPKSCNNIAKKMFKFSYSDLPKDYKSCLLYLAIFPPGHKIRRSTLIGRWVAEGIIFKEDWPSSVRRANRCFDMLIDRWLAYPADIGATGKANSCIVDDQVHGFITKIARKQHIVETRLSRHLARHFSVFNDLQLRNSEKIDTFFQRLSDSSRGSLLKVLDLEGCQCFGRKNQRYLKDICTKMLLLKYLSLRGTNITHLPREINSLRELEILDIRQTEVPLYATANVLLLKLKRLLAGHIYPSASNSYTNTVIGAPELVSSVYIPQKIDKMENMEVLSNVEARSTQGLTDIGKLWHLRKLGVVIDDKTKHLKSLLQSISDLHECLCSLSITFRIATTEGASSSEVLKLEHPPRLLESLSITGMSREVHLLPLFNKHGTSLNRLVKVTLSITSLNQDDVKVLARLPKLQCIRLRHIACTDSLLTFKEDEFKYLKGLLIDGSNLTEIIFEDGAAPELEKMVLSCTNIGSVSRVIGLKKLEEVELNNNSSRLLSSFENCKQIFKMTLRGALLEQGDLKILAKMPNMRCLVLLDNSCEVSQITFSNDEFPTLNHLIVHCPAITDIVFNSGSAPKLEKIVWSSASLVGINNLPRLKELEYSGDRVPNEVMEESIKTHKNRPVLKYKQPEI